MSSYTQILYQIVFGTKNRENVLTKPNREQLYRYIRGIITQKKCFLYCINGVEDHIHILIHLHPTVALADLVKDIKVASSIWIKEQRIFPGFTAWQIGYGAFTYSIKAKKALIHYIENQERHHKRLTFRQEYINLLEEHRVDYDARYLL